MKVIHIVAFLLTVVGGVNWGLVGAGYLTGMSFDSYNLVHMIVGSMPQVEAIVYVLVGVSALWLLVGHKSACKDCA